MLVVSGGVVCIYHVKNEECQQHGATGCDGLTLGGGVVWRHGSVDDNPVWAMEISGLKMEQRFDDTNHASQVSA
jgi:hypothetical protein